MINARGHIWEVRHEDEPNLMDRRAVLNCTVCKVEVARRRIQAFRKFSFRDREVLEQAWAAHVAVKVVKVERWPDCDLMPY